jgi:hypothetical protein
VIQSPIVMCTEILLTPIIDADLAEVMAAPARAAASALDDFEDLRRRE